MASIGGGRAHERFHMSGFIGDWHALGILLIAGVFPNQIWRMLGLWFGSSVDEGSELLVWVRAVATAVLAGVIAQILVQPPGALASVPGWLRYTALAAGCAAFFATRRSIFAGVVCGELVMLAGKWWLG
jgi:branched-subunit amino acid transport protein